MNEIEKQVQIRKQRFEACRVKLVNLLALSFLPLSCDAFEILIQIEKEYDEMSDNVLWHYKQVLRYRELYNRARGRKNNPMSNLKSNKNGKK